MKTERRLPGRPVASRDAGAPFTEEFIMKCPICKADMVEEMLNYTVDHEGHTLTLEGVPTWVCEACDHTLVEEDVIEAVEDMLEHLDTVQAGSDEAE
jgi:YgiT-type zinc finger domain-containing protein